MAILNLENFVAEYKLINNWVINKDWQKDCFVVE
jgi:hypothetical protein